MLEIGSVIPATVKRIEPYGLFLEHKGERIFVDVANFCWTPETNPVAELELVKTIDVLIIRYNYKDHISVASLKHLYPESNPYRELSRLPPDTELRGTVQYVHKDCVSVRLPNHALGLIPNTKIVGEVRPRENIRVRITSLEVDAGDLHLEPIYDWSGERRERKGDKSNY